MPDPDPAQGAAQPPASPAPLSSPGAPAPPGAQEPPDAQKPRTASARPPRGRRVLAVLLAFALGGGLGGVSSVALGDPSGLRARLSELGALARHGALPSSEGLLLSVSPAPPGTAGEGPGPWVVLEYRNVSRRATVLLYPERPGEELSFEVLGRDGRPLPGARAPERVQRPIPLHTVTLAPGERLGFVCDLGRWVRFPAGATTFRVRAERAPLGGPWGDGHRCRSAWVTVRGG